LWKDIAARTGIWGSLISYVSPIGAVQCPAVRRQHGINIVTHLLSASMVNTICGSILPAGRGYKILATSFNISTPTLNNKPVSSVLEFNSLVCSKGLEQLNIADLLPIISAILCDLFQPNFPASS
jgi:hypothetical protein